MNRGRAMLRCAVLLALLTSCSRAPAPPPASSPVTAAAARALASTLRDWTIDPPVVDDERHAPCPRLLSAAPRITEICCALGLRDRLIGRTRYCVYPPAAQSVPSIGALNDLNAEVLLELKPELILVSGSSRGITDRLTQLELRYASLPDDTLADLFTTIQRVGELTGRPQTARLLADGVRGDLDAVAARYASQPRMRVLLLIDPLPDPPTQAEVAGPGSFYDDLLRLAGHANVAQSLRRPFGRLGLEYILHADPDAIVEIAPDEAARPAGDADALRVWNKVGPLKAVAGRRVHVLAGQRHTVLGPRIAQTFEALCRALAGSADE